MALNSDDVIDEIELFELTHAVALDNALNVLVGSLYQSGLIDGETLRGIDAAYRKPLEKQRQNPLLMSVLHMHDRAFAELTASMD